VYISACPIVVLTQHCTGHCASAYNTDHVYTSIFDIDGFWKAFSVLYSLKKESWIPQAIKRHPIVRRWIDWAASNVTMIAS
jgi:hypothetical protein